ncbi:unnamed protein product [Brassica rapa]|uniref:Uncharacterized protein n=2 Tax=Brassica TaxID=3705 RepID=A0A8D9LRL1_BRACM|nr:unnamed protein product [Brassica napus]CAG7884242.1 unnamed protein product [Brassica rapa]
MKVYVLCFCSHGFIWLLQERIIIVLFRLEEVYLQLFLCLNFMIMATAQVTEKEMNPKDDDQYKVWKTLDHPTKLKLLHQITCSVVESFLAVNWAVKDDTHYILVGRLMCIIQCFSCLIFDLQTLCGHDDSINDIQCSPYDDALVVSASEDKTVQCILFSVLLLVVTDFFQSFFSFFVVRTNFTSSILGTMKLKSGLRKITRPKKENRLASP